MIIDSLTREKLWETAKDLHPSLGDLLQNEVELTLVDFSNEITKVNNLRRYLENYAKNLDTVFSEGR